MTAIENIADYGQLALRTEKPLPRSQRKLHAFLGMVTENGEYTTAVKRILIYGKEITPAMKADMLEELGDWAWYAAIAFDALGAEFQVDETFLPPQWNRKTLEDRLTYCTSFLNFTATTLLTNINAPAQGEGSIDDEKRRESMVRQLGQAMSVIGFTVDSITDGGATLNEVLGANITKLRVRFPDAYSDVAAEGRADKGGLSARES